MHKPHNLFECFSCRLQRCWWVVMEIVTPTPTGSTAEACGSATVSDCLHYTSYYSAFRCWAFLSHGLSQTSSTIRFVLCYLCDFPLFLKISLLGLLAYMSMCCSIYMKWNYARLGDRLDYLQLTLNCFEKLPSPKEVAIYSINVLFEQFSINIALNCRWKFSRSTIHFSIITYILTSMT